MSKQLLILTIADILTDKGTQSRVTLNQSAIKEYTTAIKDAIALDGEHKLEAAVEAFKVANPTVTGEDLDKAIAGIKDGLKFDEDSFLTEVNPFPPIDVFRDAQGHVYLVDGFHRINAHKDAGLKQVLANINEGTLRDALLYSVGVNKSHGVMRTQKDKRRAVEILLADDEWKGRANNWIAEQAGVSEFLVRQMRPAVGEGTTTEVRTRGGGKTQAKKKGSGGGKASTGTGGKKDKLPEIDEKTEKLIVKIEKQVGGDLGTSIGKAIRARTLPLSKRELIDFAGLSSKACVAIAPLIATKKFTSPRKAYEFTKGAISEKFLVELENRAIAGSGVFEVERNGFYLMFFNTKTHSGEVKEKAKAAKK